mgnify:CR=1 FL=1
MNNQKKLLKVILYPNEKLNKKCAEVNLEKDLPNIKKLVDLMFRTMNFFGGISLSSPQIGVGFQAVVVDLKKDDFKPLTLINPKIIDIDEEVIDLPETCLSFPMIKGYIKRFSIIKVEYFDYEGNKQLLEAKDQLSCCLQHEFDHINGINYIDRMSKTKRDIIFKKLKKRGRL